MAGDPLRDPKGESRGEAARGFVLGPATEVSTLEDSSSSPEMSRAVRGRKVDDAVGVELVREPDTVGLFIPLTATKAIL